MNGLLTYGSFIFFQKKGVGEEKQIIKWYVKNDIKIG